mmetsp:Transcript_38445/g.121018  ORF Transcript_38445/g.121018 Transcript_38445/m.121018 type:complete len:264 (-) Transcript_38445:161-952(-)
MLLDKQGEVVREAGVGHEKEDDYPVVQQGRMLCQEAVKPGGVAPQGLHDQQVMQLVVLLRIVHLAELGRPPPAQSLVEMQDRDVRKVRQARHRLQHPELWDRPALVDAVQRPAEKEEDGLHERGAGRHAPLLLELDDLVDIQGQLLHKGRRAGTGVRLPPQERQELIELPREDAAAQVPGAAGFVVSVGLHGHRPLHSGGCAFHTRLRLRHRAPTRGGRALRVHLRTLAQPRSGAPPLPKAAPLPQDGARSAGGYSCTGEACA